MCSVLEEVQTRALFYEAHGDSLPDDLCLPVTNLPTKWEIGPAPGENCEILPVIDEDLLEEVSCFIHFFYIEFCAWLC